MDWTFLPYTEVRGLPDGPLAVVFEAGDDVTLKALQDRFPDSRIAYLLRLPPRQYAILTTTDAPFHPGTVGPYSNW